MRFKCNLKELLEEKKVSVNKLSQKTGIGRARLNEYKHDRMQTYNLNTISKICEVLDCKIEDLLTLEEETIEYAI